MDSQAAIKSGSLLAIALVGALTGSSTAAAQPLRLAVVVDGATGAQATQAAREIRGTLTRDSGLSTFSWTTLAARRQRPDAVITVSFARRGDIQVMYWDRNGRADSLEAPMPRLTHQAHTAAASLSAALLRRHLPRLQAAVRRDTRHRRHLRRGQANDEPKSDEALSWLTAREIRRLKTRTRRTSVLTVQDF